MQNPQAMAELWRGGLLESVHLGHAVICDGQGIVQSWGNPDAVIFPRSSCKMVQALPLLESGAGKALTSAHLALACASHSGAALHRTHVARWLDDLGLAEGDLRCGPQEPDDRDERDRLIRADEAPCQVHNNCSGKHTGFLMLNRHMRGGPEYADPDHPLQTTIRRTFEEVTGEPSPGYGIDGCSAPNFATTVTGLARAMAAFARATGTADARDRAMHALTRAMMAHPDLVAGEGKGCTELMRAMGGRAAVKTGAEGVYVAIIPERGIGIALKIIDGGTRGAEAAITALLVQLGVLEAGHPAALKRLDAVQRNRRGIPVGILRAAPGFPV
ncbi:MAG: asparaginase [Gemmobacter sp.]